jgi:hypothetical protein
MVSIASFLIFKKLFRELHVVGDIAYFDQWLFIKVMMTFSM